MGVQEQPEIEVKSQIFWGNILRVYRNEDNSFDATLWMYKGEGEGYVEEKDFKTIKRVIRYGNLSEMGLEFELNPDLPPDGAISSCILVIRCGKRWLGAKRCKVIEKDLIICPREIRAPF